MTLATLTAGDLAAIITSIVCLAAVVVLVVVLQRLVATLTEVRDTVAAVRTDLVPTLHDLRDAVAEASTDLERVDDLIGTAESLANTVDAASRTAYLSVANPVIKTVAFAKGTSRAAKRLRGKEAG
ncbi:MAG TPA: hypothetical protein VID05_04710 [Acidimicrobiales bacterium]|jgi:hypothetical protein